MNKCWFKIWSVGNGGIPSAFYYVYWPDLGHDEWEMSYMIGCEFGLPSSGTRSYHWEREAPPKEHILEHVRLLQIKVKSIQQEIDIHQLHLEE